MGGEDAATDIGLARPERLQLPVDRGQLLGEFGDPLPDLADLVAYLGFRKHGPSPGVCRH